MRRCCEDFSFMALTESVITSHKRPSPNRAKRDIFRPSSACRFRRKKMGRPAQRRSVTAETEPCVLAIVVKAERAMQCALISVFHVPSMGIHPCRISRSVAVVMTAEKAIRI